MTSIDELDRLRVAVATCAAEPYLLTVTGDLRPHCGVVTVRWDAGGDRMLVPAPSSWPGSAVAGCGQVTLLWPPAVPGGYSLMVDGTAEAAGDGMLTVAVTRGVWHRPGDATGDGRSSCASDCKPILG